MAAIAEQHLEKLRTTGLLVTGAFVPNHIKFPGGVTVWKPASVSGNAMEAFEIGGRDGERILVDAPCLYLHCEGNSWFVTCHEYVPGPGPGDFVNKWSTADGFEAPCASAPPNAISIAANPQCAQPPVRGCYLRNWGNRDTRG